MVRGIAGHHVREIARDGLVGFNRNRDNFVATVIGLSPTGSRSRSGRCHEPSGPTVTPGERTMASKDPSADLGRDPWTEFAARWADHPHLQIDPLYALPEPLVDQIKIQIPNFFGTSGEDFERDLVRTAGGGFFLQSPFDCLLLTGPTDPRILTNDKNLRAMLSEMMRDDGKNEAQIQEYEAREAAFRKDAELRRLAYSNWLITNETYRAELDRLREVSEEFIVSRRGFPHLSHPHLKPTLSPTERASLVKHRPSVSQRIEAEFHRFYRRWGLERLLTWDLPRPLEPELAGIYSYDQFDLNEAGVTFFVPWYLLRDKNIQLGDLVAQLKISRDLSHLKDWLDRDLKAKDAKGITRWATIFEMYRYLCLAIASRYDLSRRLQKLDIAFGQFLIKDMETIRKLRPDAQRIASR